MKNKMIFLFFLIQTIFVFPDQFFREDLEYKYNDKINDQVEKMRNFKFQIEKNIDINIKNELVISIENLRTGYTIERILTKDKEYIRESQLVIIGGFSSSNDTANKRLSSQKFIEINNINYLNVVSKLNRLGSIKKINIDPILFIKNTNYMREYKNILIKNEEDKEKVIDKIPNIVDIYRINISGAINKKLLYIEKKYINKEKLGVEMDKEFGIYINLNDGNSILDEDIKFLYNLVRSWESI